MADEKKEKGGGGDMTNELVALLFVIFFVWLIYNRVMYYTTEWRANNLYTFGYTIKNFFVNFVWPVLQILSAIISLIAVFGISYVYKRLTKLNEEEKDIYGLVAVPVADGGVPERKNPKWDRVIELINSPDPSNWRLAIIEADIMLDELLKTMGYHGETLGERLKAVEQSDFTTIESAWEAHKIRNKIAHQGSDFPLNEREAKLAIANFETVFQEFKII